MICFLDDSEAANFYHKQLVKKIDYTGEVNFSGTVKGLYETLLKEDKLKATALLVLDYYLPDGRADDIVSLLVSKHNFEGNVIIASSSKLPVEVLTALKLYDNVTVAEKPLRKELLEKALF